jgi:hypothetical protein
MRGRKPRALAASAAVGVRAGELVAVPPGDVITGSAKATDAATPVAAVAAEGVADAWAAALLLLLPVLAPEAPPRRSIKSGADAAGCKSSVGESAAAIPADVGGAVPLMLTRPRKRREGLERPLPMPLPLPLPGPAPAGERKRSRSM